ncbi:WhiB family transcriptional regulator [Streptomyces fodineus]|uniref:WhiB family transcriptional regulator n=1 Tax=Streptomyces fodineus TaxID=1904616 RepID=UPI00131BD962
MWQVRSGFPVREGCLQHGLETGERWGVWGGIPAGTRQWSAADGASKRRCPVRDGRRLARPL